MTATQAEARHGLILLPIKCSCPAHAQGRCYNRGSIPTPVGSPICRGSGVHPHHTTTPDLPGIGRGTRITGIPIPRRFPSGVPCPDPTGSLGLVMIPLTVRVAATGKSRFERSPAGALGPQWAQFNLKFNGPALQALGQWRSLGGGGGGGGGPGPETASASGPAGGAPF